MKFDSPAPSTQADTTPVQHILTELAPKHEHSALADFAAGLGSHLKAPLVGVKQLLSGKTFDDDETAWKKPEPESKAKMAGEMVADATIFLGVTAIMRRLPAGAALAPIEAGGAIGFIAPLKNGEGMSQRLVHAASGAATMALIEKGPKLLASTGLIKSAETSLTGTFVAGSVIGAGTEQINTYSRTGHFADLSQTATGAVSFGLTGSAFHGLGLAMGVGARTLGERSRLQDMGSIVSSRPNLALLPQIESLFRKGETSAASSTRSASTEGWHLVLGSGGSKAALTGAGVVLATRAAKLKIETIGGVSGGFVPAALAATDMSSQRLLQVAKDTDIAALLTQRPIFTEVVRQHKRLDLLKDGLYDTTPLGAMVESHMPGAKWPEKLWTMAVGGEHSEVIFTKKGVTEYSPSGQHVLDNKAPSVGDAVRATSAIPGVLASMTMYGRRLYDGALGKFGKCPSDMATTHFGIPEERIIASLPTGAMTATNARLYRLAKYLSGNSEHGAGQLVEHAGIVIRPEVNSFHSLRFSLQPAQREEAILAGYRAALEQFAQRGLIKGIPLVQARGAGESMSAMEAYFAPKPKFPFSINTDILRLTGPK
ncbi:MAG: patatin-like phospholipase family protein [Cyanobacteria bacterium REEB67]|nr:patatin-like phospholipase family protein [Cyanobacteria bacterium REEB67]